MAVYRKKDSKYFWYKFMFDGKLVQRSSKVTNRREAVKIEMSHRTMLAKGEVGLDDQKRVPTLREFKQPFIDFIQIRNANKPATILFYSQHLKRLLECEAMLNVRLDRIDEVRILRYIANRRKKVGIVAVNHDLRTLRRLLHIAFDRKAIRRIPKVRLLLGEPMRDFVLDPTMESAYLEACPPLLHDVAVVLLDSGLRLGEALALQWSEVHLEPAGEGRYGWIQVKNGKTKYANRTVPISPRVSQLLKDKQKTAISAWVFPGDSPDKPLLGTSLAHMHAKVCRPIKDGKKEHVFPKEFVLHSLRHTCLTRHGQTGTDAFTIKKLAGHSSITVSQRYVHPTSETVQLAFDRLEELNRQAVGGSSGKN